MNGGTCNFKTLRLSLRPRWLLLLPAIALSTSTGWAAPPPPLCALAAGAAEAAAFVVGSLVELLRALLRGLRSLVAGAAHRSARSLQAASKPFRVDPAFVVAQLDRLCPAERGEVLAILRAARKAGLE